MAAACPFRPGLTAVVVALAVASLWCAPQGEARLDTAPSPRVEGATCAPLTEVRKSHGWFRSGGVAYAPGSDCRWHILTPIKAASPSAPMVITVTFNYIDTEEG